MSIRTLSKVLVPVRSFSSTIMAKSKFEYVKEFETDDRLLPNCWIVVRVDGKSFHKFAEHHEFKKPNDIRALKLMNHAALCVMEEFPEITISFGQSDEYSFIVQKNATIYKRRASKIMSTINSKFTSSYVCFWSKYFESVKLKYPPSFDGRIILYPTDENLIDYLSWRQADVHINNLYNTTFWNLVIKAKLTPAEAEKKLGGTLASHKNEILFSEFNINYNNEPAIFRKGTTLLRKQVLDPVTNKNCKVIVNLTEDIIQNKFWKKHSELLLQKPPTMHSLQPEIDNFIIEQLEMKRLGI